MKALALALLFACGSSSSRPTTITNAAPPPEPTCCCLFTDGAQELTHSACSEQRGTCDSEMTECYSVGPVP